MPPVSILKMSCLQYNNYWPVNLACRVRIPLVTLFKKFIEQKFETLRKTSEIWQSEQKSWKCHQGVSERKGRLRYGIKGLYYMGFLLLNPRKLNTRWENISTVWCLHVGNFSPFHCLSRGCCLSKALYRPLPGQARSLNNPQKSQLTALVFASGLSISHSRLSFEAIGLKKRTQGKQRFLSTSVLCCTADSHDYFAAAFFHY